MKKKIFTLLALFACVLSASAQTTSTLAVKDAYVLSGGTGTINLELNNPDETYVGYSFTLTLPAGIVPQTEMKDLLDAETNTTKPTEVVKADMGTRHAATHALRTNITVNGDGTRTIGFVVLSGSSDIIKDKSGVLMQIYVETTLAASSTPLAGKISNAKFSNGVTDAEPADINFNIIVTDKVILDETSTALPATQDGVDVLVKRNIKAGQWSTICLPFDMTEAQVKSVFGSDMELVEFSDYEANGASIIIKFTAAETDKKGILLASNTPYLVKTSAAITDFTVDDVDIEADEDNAYAANANKLAKATGVFWGTLKAGIIVPADNLFISDNKFYYSTGSTVIKGFRGYFWIEDFKSSSSSPEILIDINGNTTSIDEIRGLFEEGAFYDMKGMKIENPTKKGVYIQNGKKVVVK